MSNPLLGRYLQHSYSSAFSDLQYLNRLPNFSKKDFSCWLCGVAGASTAEKFLDFIFNKNPLSDVTILDLGEDQIKEIRKLIEKKYSDKKIRLIRANALDANKYFRQRSVDWIDTDNIMMFFDNKSLKKLLVIWRNILKDNGWISFRESARKGKFGVFFDWVLIRCGKYIFDAKLVGRSVQELRKMIGDSGFRFHEGNSLLPTVKRFCLVKNDNPIT